ncbi:MAG: NAD(+) synthase [Clostridiales bacterium]|nr:NAD(+) synthase [Clostridiales bacterium]
MTIAIGQMEIFPADLRRNKQAMLALVEVAKNNGAELMIFPELAVSGLTAGAHFYDRAFLGDCARIGADIAAAAGGLAVIFGNVEEREGKLYNTCFMAKDGQLGRLEAPLGQSFIPHAYRPFAKDAEAKTYMLDINNKLYRCAFLLGDWRNKPLPFRTKDIDLLVNLSAAPYVTGGDEPAAFVEGRPYIQVSGCGLQSVGKTHYLLPGGSYMRDLKGNIIAREPDYYESVGLWGIKSGGRRASVLPEDAMLGEAMVKGVRCFCDGLDMQKAVIGLSGGIDSALAACVYSLALGPNQVLALQMPGKYSSHTTQDMAARLTAAIGLNRMDMPIQTAQDALCASFAWSSAYDAKGEQFKLELDMKAQENMQARERMRLMAAAAAAWQAIFTCNSNKSELTVGYTTFYGDLAGAFAAQADLWKYQIYLAAAYFQRQYFPEAPLKEIAGIRPSAELSPQQDVDKGLGDPLVYAYHDYLLKAWVEENESIATVLRWYCDGVLPERLGVTPELIGQLFKDAAALVQDLEYWWVMYNGLGVAKRMQAPPLLALSRHPFGEPRQEIQLPPYFGDDYLQLKAELLRR